MRSPAPLACPDLFVIDAPDRAAREQVAGELIRLAAARGERVLALSPDPAAADRLAEIVAADPSIPVVRALADDENPLRPSPTATRLTSVAAGAGRVDRMGREAAAAVTEAGSRLARLTTAAERLEVVRELTARLDEIATDRTALVRRPRDARRRGPPGTDGQPGGSPKPSPGSAPDRDAATAPLVAARAAVAAQRAEKEAALAAARQHAAEARDETGKKSGFFARLLNRPKPPTDPLELERHVHDLEREVKDLADREVKLGVEIDAAGGRFADECEKQITDDLSARRCELEARLHGLDAEADRLGRAIGEHRPAFAAAGLSPTPGARGGRRPRHRPGRRRAGPRRRPHPARRTQPDGAGSGPPIPGRVSGRHRHPTSLDADPVFSPDGPRFDLLVLDHAEDLTDPDFTRLSRLAGRWVLLGEVTAPGRPTRSVDRTDVRVPGRPPARPGAVGGGGRPAGVPTRPPDPDQRHGLVREPVLDRPDVELRLTAGPAGDPVLAEIAFPVTTPVAAAKAFLVEQLGDFPLRPVGERYWHRTADRLVACWPVAEIADAAAGWVDLASGVCEKVVGTGPAAFTAAVTFDPAAGWDEGKAEEWLSARLPAGFTGRVAVLPRLVGAGPARRPPAADRPASCPRPSCRISSGSTPSPEASR